jgi:hypothetical protein
MLAIGGFVGFGGSFLSALSVAGDDISSALLRGSIGMIVGVVLIKILLALAHSVFKDARRAKMQIEAAAANKEETPAAHEPAPAAASAHHAKQKP